MHLCKNQDLSLQKHRYMLAEKETTTLYKVYSLK